jgi:hypothetical protein
VRKRKEGGRKKEEVEGGKKGWKWKEAVEARGGGKRWKEGVEARWKDETRACKMRCER